MKIDKESYSGCLMEATTQFRNNPGIGHKAAGQIGYALATCAAAVETAVALTFTVIALVMIPFAPEPFDRVTHWLNSSAITFAWALTNFMINPFFDRIPHFDE